jgi:hypothetical protein
MHAKHADELSALTELWLGASDTAMALGAFVLAPASIRLPIGDKIDARWWSLSGSVTGATASKSG